MMRSFLQLAARLRACELGDEQLQQRILKALARLSGDLGSSISLDIYTQTFQGAHGCVGDGIGALQ